MSTPAIGREVTREAECGCWSSCLFAPDGELLELKVLICEDHMNLASSDMELRIRSAGDQLTLPLPSAEGDRERVNHEANDA
jgi:hypothetical protein